MKTPLSSRSAQGDSFASERGVALVITLIMLSVVTITAVAFLSMSRRERTAVGASVDQTDAKYMADAGLSRAQATLAARMIGLINDRPELQSTNRALPYVSDAPRIARSEIGFLVSTNWHTPIPDPLNPGEVANVVRSRLQAAAAQGAPAFNNKFSFTNILYPPYLSGQANSPAYLALLRSLYYDPRPPVFRTQAGLGNTLNNSGPIESQHFLDLNRNGRYDTNGLVPQFDRYGNLLPGFITQKGDPEWIGILERPDEPHSGNNRFVGRYAYFVQPVGRTLDLNYIHNSAKGQGYLPQTGRYVQPAPGAGVQDGFLRNQGIGSWELNLAGLLVDLNTNAWPAPIGPAGVQPGRYDYMPNQGGANSGQAFRDAAIIYRKNREWVFQKTLREAVVAPSVTDVSPLVNRRFDSDFYADGPVLLRYEDILPTGATRFSVNRADGISSLKDWPGSDSAGIYSDIFQLVSPSFLPAASLTNSLIGRANGSFARSTYDAGTFYRFLDSVGSDSPDARFESGIDFQGRYYRRAKLNLNHAQEVNSANLLEQVNVGRAFTSASGAYKPFSDWAPLEWFTNAVERLSSQQFESQALYPKLAVAAQGTTPPRPAVEAIILRGYGTFATNANLRVDYSARSHQLFQLAANIYEATHFSAVNYPGNQLTTNRRANTPITYRPTFYLEPSPNTSFRNSGLIRLAGFTEVTNPSISLSQRWIDPANLSAADITGLLNTYSKDRPATNINIYGVPWVVGTKKGFPALEEAFWQTSIDITRRLEARKVPNNSAPIAVDSFPGAGKTRQLALQYFLNITNRVGVDALNSYSTVFNRATRVVATNLMEVRFGYRPPNLANVGNPSTFAEYLPLPNGSLFQALSRNFTINSWGQAPVEILSGFWTNSYRIIPSSSIPILAPVNARSAWDNAQDLRSQYFDLAVEVRNRLVYAVIDESAGGPPRIIDFVNLESRMEQTDLLNFLRKPGVLAQSITPGLTGQGVARVEPSDYWSVLRTGASGFTRGIENQLLVSLGNLEAVDYTDRPRGTTFPNSNIRDTQIRGLRYFMYGILPSGFSASDRSLVDFLGNECQLGYNPTHTVHLTDRRMANDPLVHYTMEDLGPGATVISEPQEYTEVVMFPGLAGRIPLSDDASGRQSAPIKQLPLTYQIGQTKRVRIRAPWGVEPVLGFGAVASANAPESTAYDLAYKDPLITKPDDWRFPIGKMATIGELGRVHRGTPWQTIYMKAAMPDGPSTRLAKLAAEKGVNLPAQPTIAGRYIKTFPDGTSAKQWMAWAGNAYTRPENDWMIFDLFTTALNENAAKGLLSVNNTNRAAWSAVLSGVPVIADTQVSLNKSLGHTDATTRTPVISPASRELVAIVDSINEARESQNRLGGRFLHIGDVFSAPAMTAGDNEFVQLNSPAFQVRNQSLFLAPFNSRYGAVRRPNSEEFQVARVPDEVLERIPQQIVGLLRQDEPKFVVYAYGQSLKPAPGAILTTPGPFFGLCTNYVVTGEHATRTVLRFDGSPAEPRNSSDVVNRLRLTVEDHRALAPPQ